MCNQETIYLEPAEGFILPYDDGDSEFGRYRLFVWARIVIRNEKKLWLKVFMQAQKIKRDYAEVVRQFEREWYIHNRPILNILSDSYSEVRYTDDLEADHLSPDLGNLVKEFIVTGDTYGQTGVSISFNPVIVEVPA